jgi:transcriptional regulator with XRE-family HTH domain
MKLNKKYKINSEFGDLFTFKNKKEELKHEATMIMFRFLSEVERITDNNLSKKDLAKLIDTSASYVTQLFNGDKLLNFLKLAKLQDALNIKFNIVANAEKDGVADASTDQTPKAAMVYEPIIPEKYHFIEMYKKLIEANSEKLDYAQDSKTPFVVQVKNQEKNIAA